MVDLLVTYMEMTAPPEREALSRPVIGVQIGRERLSRVDYLDLYRAVGEPLQWDQRLRMTWGALDTLLGDIGTEIYVLRLGERAIGLCEFVGAGSHEVELTNFGLVAEFQGRGLGPFLLDHALRSVWARSPHRVWLHTDTNDHANAQATYRRAGFRVHSQRWETFPD